MAFFAYHAKIYTSFCVCSFAREAKEFDNLWMNIGAAIRYTREQLGLKLEAVAIEAGFDAGNLSRIERGKQTLSIPKLESIAKAMNVRVIDLYTLVEPALSTPQLGQLRDTDGGGLAYGDDIQAIRRGYSLLDPKQRKLVQEFIKLLNRLQKDGETVSES